MHNTANITQISNGVNISFAFFGTGPLAESVLATLYRNGFVPKLLVTKPDTPQGRHLHITAPHIKTWCEMKDIKVFQPASLREIGNDSPLHTEKFDVFIVASYGKIIPDEILNIAKMGILNVHPSLLPKYRGASPIESALLNGEAETGVTIIKLDSGVDSGPILAQTAFKIDKQATAGTLEVSCGQIGGELLVQVLPAYVEENLIPKEQNHDLATFCKKIEKEMGEIKLSDKASDVRNKFRALTPWPSLYFFQEHHGKNMRVKINSLDLTTEVTSNDTAKEIILTVTPEGKKEMDWASFLRGYVK